MNETPALPDEIAAQLCAALAPVELAPARAAALRERIFARIQGEAPPVESGIVTQRGSAPGWIEVLPKVHIRLLHTDGSAESYLVRLEAGARAPAHDHPASEECIVLEGEVKYLSGATLRAGDYQIAARGAHHTELASETGALVFLRYAQPLASYIKL